MKKILFFIAFISILFMNVENSCAQSNNLQFSQVLLVSTLQTVPAGKVWKVESVLSSTDLGVCQTGGCINSNYFTIIVNGLSIFFGSRQVLNNSSASLDSTGNLTALPIWLPAGTTLNKGINTAFVSVIEYNIVP